MFKAFTRGALIFGGVATLLIGSVGTTSASPLGQHVRHAELGVAAKTLGLSDVKALRAELGGTTLTAVAQKHNVAPATVASAIKADLDTKVDGLVAAGQLKAARGAKVKSRVEARVDRLMTREFKAKS